MEFDCEYIHELNIQETFIVDEASFFQRVKKDVRGTVSALWKYNFPHTVLIVN